MSGSWIVHSLRVQRSSGSTIATSGRLEVDVATSTRLIELIPGEITAVAESGLRSLDEVRTLREGGYGAFLIGEALMAAPDPGRALESLLTN